MILKQDGSVWVTGLNSRGQHGDGSSNRASFVEVFSSGVQAVAVGSFHSMVMKQDGSVWSAGFNQHGQLSHGTTTDTRKFTLISVSDVTEEIVTGARVVSVIMTRT